VAETDLNLVRTFLRLYETRSVTRTAEQMSLTQPSVSHALRRLRKQFNDNLFPFDVTIERSSNAVSGKSTVMGCLAPVVDVSLAVRTRTAVTDLPRHPPPSVGSRGTSVDLTDDGGEHGRANTLG
jgi:hypothetical protein